MTPTHFSLKIRKVLSFAFRMQHPPFPSSPKKSPNRKKCVCFRAGFFFGPNHFEPGLISHARPLQSDPKGGCLVGALCGVLGLWGRRGGWGGVVPSRPTRKQPPQLDRRCQSSSSLVTGRNNNPLPLFFVFVDQAEGSGFGDAPVGWETLRSRFVLPLPLLVRLSAKYLQGGDIAVILAY